MSFKPEVTVAAIVERDAAFLVVEERIAGRLVLNQPAGHLEDRETLLEAVVRETREETAWRLTPDAFIGTYLWRHPLTGRTTLRFAFSGRVDSHDPRQRLDTGIVRALWMTAAELTQQASRLRSPLVLRCIEDYFAGRRQSLDSVAYLGLEEAVTVDAVVNL
jgi:8-oxo-dGTP pyrophosphatase MutT (NUDIX family)